MVNKASGSTGCRTRTMLSNMSHVAEHEPCYRIRITKKQAAPLEQYDAQHSPASSNAVEQADQHEHLAKHEHAPIAKYTKNTNYTQFTKYELWNICKYQKIF